MRRSPLAKGSSVPAWPIRDSPKSTRSRATASWEVQPSGLSTRWRRSAIHRPVERLENGSAHPRQIAAHAGARRVLVPAPAEAARDLVHIDGTVGSEAHADLARSHLLDQDADARPVQRFGELDDPVGVFRSRAGLFEHLAADRERPDQSAGPLLEGRE